MTTTTGTPVTCPPSEVHDQEMLWFEVCEGDLVKYDGQWHRLERSQVTRPELLGVLTTVDLRREGVTARHWVGSDAITLVRRYLTEED